MDLALPAKAHRQPCRESPVSHSHSHSSSHGRKAWQRSGYRSGSPRGRRVGVERETGQQQGVVATSNGNHSREGVGVASAQRWQELPEALRQAPPWQELQETLRQEWVDFSSTLEDRMQEHFQRQEMLFNQQALRIEGIVTARSSDGAGDPNREAKATSSPSKSGSQEESPEDGSTQSISRSPEAQGQECGPQPGDVCLPETVHRNHSSHSHGHGGHGSHGGHNCSDTFFQPEHGHILPEALRANTKQVAGVAAVMNPSSRADLSVLERAALGGGDDEERVLRLSLRSVEGVDKAVDDLIGKEQPRKPKQGKEQNGIHGELPPLNAKALIMEPSDIFSNLLEWWMAVEEPERRGWLAEFMDGRTFELLSAIVVVFNSVVTVYTTNSEAVQKIEEDSLTIDMINFSFVIYYSLEIMFKLYVHRLYFFFNSDMWWNLFDSSLVILAFNDMLLRRVIDTKSIDMSAMRTLRVIRLAKILRVVRVMRYFPELRLMLNSVLGSVVSLFWSIVMLGLMFFIFSLVFVQGATTARIHDRSLMPEEEQVLEENLGSVQAGMLTLYQTTTGGDDWMTFYRAIKHTGDANCFLFLFFIAFAQFALLNILTGIFVENAMKLAQPDRDTLALQKRKQEVSEANELRRLFEAVDTERTGFINAEHFKQHLQSEQFKARLAMMGLDIKDAELFFGVVSDFGTSEVEVEAFVSGAMRLKGLASALDLQTLTFGTKVIHANQIKFQRSIEERFNQVLGCLRS